MADQGGPADDDRKRLEQLRKAARRFVRYWRIAYDPTHPSYLGRDLGGAGGLAFMEAVPSAIRLRRMLEAVKEVEEERPEDDSSELPPNRILLHGIKTCLESLVSKQNMGFGDRPWRLHVGEYVLPNRPGETHELLNTIDKYAGMLTGPHESPPARRDPFAQVNEGPPPGEAGSAPQPTMSLAEFAGRLRDGGRKSAVILAKIVEALAKCPEIDYQAIKQIAWPTVTADDGTIRQAVCRINKKAEDLRLPWRFRCRDGFVKLTDS